MRPNSASSLLVDLLGTADFRERERVAAWEPFCFQDKLILTWVLSLMSTDTGASLAFLLQALESNTHMGLWLGCFCFLF